VSLVEGLLDGGDIFSPKGDGWDSSEGTVRLEVKKKKSVNYPEQKKMEDEADNDLAMMLVVREDGFQQQQGL